MATAYHNLSEYDINSMPDASDMKVAIAAAEWNAEITDALLKGAVDTLMRNGVKQENIYVARVPGTVELTFASQQMAEFWASPTSTPSSEFPSSSGYSPPTPWSRPASEPGAGWVTKATKPLWQR